VEQVTTRMHRGEHWSGTWRHGLSSPAMVDGVVLYAYERQRDTEPGSVGAGRPLWRAQECCLGAGTRINHGGVRSVHSGYAGILSSTWRATK